MAYTIPETIRSTATAGERLLFRTLKTYLPEDYIVYYEPEIRGRRPDFVIIGPDLGLIVLEVKDYTKNTLFQLTPDEWTIVNTAGEQTTVKSPLRQARDNAFHIVDTLKKDRNLVQLEGKYQFQLKFPYGFGSVYTRLHQKEFIQHDIYRVVDPNLCLTRDEIDPNHDAFSEEVLIEKIMNMFVVPYRLRDPLEQGDIDAIRYHLFPEVRISAEFKQPSPYQDQLLLSLHDIQAMDLHQENLARQIGDKNRIIRGVAGSGKTLILASRAKLLAKQHPDWKILILCYNISLARTIEQMIRHKMQEPEELFDFDFTKENGEAAGSSDHSIRVRNFHSWLKHDLNISEGQLPVILQKLKEEEAILPMYDAVLIDEGQDFAPEWFQLVSRLLNPATKSLLLVEDRAQSIYKRKRSYLKDTGLDFRGRSKVLSINYRNTAQIIEFSWNFYKEHSILRDKVAAKDFEGEIISPQSTRRKGFEPAIYKAPTFFHEAEMTAKQIVKLHKEYNIPYTEMLILYRVRKTYKMDYAAVLIQTLQKYGIPHYWLAKDAEAKRNYKRSDEHVTISTIDSSKGLDFQAVFVVNIDNMPFALEEDEEREASLLYIAMTRAKQYLCLSYSGESAYTAYFDALLEDRKKDNADDGRRSG